MAWMKILPTLTPVNSSSPVVLERSTASFRRWQKEVFTCERFFYIFNVESFLCIAHLDELLNIEEDAGQLV